MTPKFDPMEEDIRVCHFTKHKDKAWADVIDEDPDYVDWIMRQDISEELYDYLEDLLTGENENE